MYASKLGKFVQKMAAFVERWLQGCGRIIPVIKKEKGGGLRGGCGCDQEGGGGAGETGYFK